MYRAAELTTLGSGRDGLGVGLDLASDGVHDVRRRNATLTVDFNPIEKLVSASTALYIEAGAAPDWQGAKSEHIGHM